MSIQYLSADSLPSDSAGQPLPLGVLTFYQERTSELATVYTSAALTTPLTNPVVADGMGVFPEVWLAPTTRYRVKLETAQGVLIYDCPEYRPYQTDSAFLYLDAQIRSLVDGVPVSGAELSFTDDLGNPVASYADAACTVPQTRPVVSDAAGLFPAIYLATPVVGYPRVAPALAVTQDSASQPVDLAWTAAEFGASAPTEYQVYVSVNGSAFALLASVSGVTLSYADEADYDNDDELLYYVRGVLAGNDPLDSNEDGLTYEEAPTPPVVLMHFEGDNGGAVFTDEAGHTFTRTGTESITTTAQAKFGTTSARFWNSNTDYIQSDDSADFVITGDFSLDFWLYWDGIGGSTFNLVEARNNGSTWRNLLSIFVSKLRTFSSGDGPTISTNVWQHIAVGRTGTSISIFLGGVLGHAITDNSAMSPGTGGLKIGAINSSGQWYVDELRLVIGVNQFTGNFTPPVAPYTYP